jgi:hypothetical protein
MLFRPPLDPRGETHLLAWGRGGGPNSDEGKDTLVLNVLYTMSRLQSATSINGMVWLYRLQNQWGAGHVFLADGDYYLSQRLLV